MKNKPNTDSLNALELIAWENMMLSNQAKRLQRSFNCSDGLYQGIKLMQDCYEQNNYVSHCDSIVRENFMNDLTKAYEKFKGEYNGNKKR